LAAAVSLVSVLEHQKMPKTAIAASILMSSPFPTQPKAVVPTSMLMSSVLLTLSICEIHYSKVIKMYVTYRK